MTEHEGRLRTAIERMADRYAATAYATAREQGGLTRAGYERVARAERRRRGALCRLVAALAAVAREARQEVEVERGSHAQTVNFDTYAELWQQERGELVKQIGAQRRRADEWERRAIAAGWQHEQEGDEVDRAAAVLRTVGYRPGLRENRAAALLLLCERDHPGISGRAWNAALHKLDREGGQK